MAIDNDRWRTFLLNLVDEAEAAGAAEPERAALNQFVRMRRAMWWAHWRLRLHRWDSRWRCHICQDLREHIPARDPDLAEDTDADEAEG